MRGRLMDVPQPGGVGQRSPQGLGGVNVRPNQPPAAEPVGAPAPTPEAPPEDFTRTPARPRAQAPQRLAGVPRVDEEFPISDLADATGGPGTNVAATGLGERFYRRYGRYPTDADLGIISLRRRFENETGRPPTRDELLAAVRQNTVNREDEFLG